MARDTLLGFPAHTLPYRRGKFITLSTASTFRFRILKVLENQSKIQSHICAALTAQRTRAEILWLHDTIMKFGKP